MVNSTIAMQGKTVDTATPMYQAQQQQYQNALAAEQTLKAHYENMNEREKSRLASTIAGAVQLKQYLDKDDVEGAHNFLMQRKEALQNRMGSGDNVDTQETDYAIQALRTGNIDQLKTDIAGVLAAGQVYGILSNKDMPSNVQEWQYYNALSPEDQNRYKEMKRANQVANLGGTTVVVGPDGKPINTYEHTLRPEDQPINARNKAEATAQGTAAGDANNPKVEQGKGKLSTVLNEIRANYQALDQKGAAVNTTKSAVANIGASLGASDVGQAIGKRTGSEEQSIRNKINNQIPALISAIRQSTGMSAKAMDSNTELKFYLQQATDPKLDIQANLAALDTLEQLYGKSGGQPMAAPGGGTKVRVRNPQTGEAFEIDSGDLAAAQAEGFVQQ